MPCCFLKPCRGSHHPKSILKRPDKRTAEFRPRPPSPETGTDVDPGSYGSVKQAPCTSNLAPMCLQLRKACLVFVIILCTKQGPHSGPFCNVSGTLKGHGWGHDVIPIRKSMSVLDKGPLSSISTIQTIGPWYGLQVWTPIHAKDMPYTEWRQSQTADHHKVP